jgi:ATP-dependent Clp protease adaptor protein ClpS
MGTSTEVFEEVRIDEKIKKEAREPSKYKVVMLNDETTPMEWVIGMLTTIFNHSQETAEKLTLQIHSEGSGIAGIYTYEIAEQKSVETINASRDRGFPLQVRIDTE